MEPVEVKKPQSLRKTRKNLAAIVIAALAVSTAVYLFTGSDTGTTVNITSATLHLGYGSASDSYFGSPAQGITANYETYSGGHIFHVMLSFHNSGTSTHKVTAIYVKLDGFVVVSENPSLPVSVSSGETVHISVAVKAPNTNYAGPLDIYAVVE